MLAFKDIFACQKFQSTLFCYCHYFFFISCFSFFLIPRSWWLDFQLIGGVMLFLLFSFSLIVQGSSFLLCFWKFSWFYSHIFYRQYFNLQKTDYPPFRSHPLPAVPHLVFKNPSKLKSELYHSWVHNQWLYPITQILDYSCSLLLSAQ